ncbi:MAG: MgtC/SapB family protein [Gammaproteobacteria bacterium]|nr:MgtC/SapB family protein [Gammaproteobacteria bacterium]
MGFLIGLEREMGNKGQAILGLRDFILIALSGALSAFFAIQYQSNWIIGLSFTGILVILVSSYWADRQHSSGITTELAALITFFLGCLIIFGNNLLAIVLAIVTLGILFPKTFLKQLSGKINATELGAVLLFLTITFIVLPVLPNQPLNNFITFKAGSIIHIDQRDKTIVIKAEHDELHSGQYLEVIDKNWMELGRLKIIEPGKEQLKARFEGDYFDRLYEGQAVRSRLNLEPLYVSLAAINPYRIWLIVVLVSFVSFLGYILIKTIGSGAGVALTGLVGGLVSSTVTTISFARRSLESSAAIPLFTAAVILASAIMFPRLIIEIGIFNQELMKSIAVPLIAMGVTGLLLAVLSFRYNKATEGDAIASISFNNPFSLKSALTFALLFTLILAITRLATTYLGSAWLPVVAIVSGLTDADAIAFSISSLQRNGLISLEWASFNLVLGALSNTFMKLFLVLGLGHRMLFHRLLWNFAIIGTVGIITMLFYYDLSALKLSSS